MKKLVILFLFSIFFLVVFFIEGVSAFIGYVNLDNAYGFGNPDYFTTGLEACKYAAGPNRVCQAPEIESDSGTGWISSSPTYDCNTAVSSMGFTGHRAVCYITNTYDCLDSDDPGHRASGGGGITSPSIASLSRAGGTIESGKTAKLDSCDGGDGSNIISEAYCTIGGFASTSLQVCPTGKLCYSDGPGRGASCMTPPACVDSDNSVYPPLLSTDPSLNRAGNVAVTGFTRYDSCDSTNKKRIYEGVCVNNNPIAAIATCDIGRICQGTTDFLNSTSAACVSGCANNTDCDDGNSCTSDACNTNTNTCSHTDTCGGGPYCGDGSCNNGETSATCPSDCTAPGPTCNNRACESGETAGSCPQDCGCIDPDSQGMFGLLNVTLTGQQYNFSSVTFNKQQFGDSCNTTDARYVIEQYCVNPDTSPLTTNILCDFGGGCTSGACQKACNNDGTKDPWEQCDGSDLGGANCSSSGGAVGTSGLSCNLDCTFNSSGCSFSPEPIFSYDYQPGGAQLEAGWTEILPSAVSVLPGWASGVSVSGVDGDPSKTGNVPGVPAPYNVSVDYHVVSGSEFIVDLPSSSPIEYGLSFYFGPNVTGTGLFNITAEGITLASNVNLALNPYKNISSRVNVSDGQLNVNFVHAPGENFSLSGIDAIGYCGDAIPLSPEECDDGIRDVPGTDAGGCIIDTRVGGVMCKNAVCGDGYVSSVMGEVCDGGGNCNPNCKLTGEGCSLSSQQFNLNGFASCFDINDSSICNSCYPLLNLNPGEYCSWNGASGTCDLQRGYGVTSCKTSLVDAGGSCDGLSEKTVSVRKTGAGCDCPDSSPGSCVVDQVIPCSKAIALPFFDYKNFFSAVVVILLAYLLYYDLKPKKKS